MSPIIALHGTPSKKFVHHAFGFVVPFVGADSGGDFSEVGIGILHKGDITCFWGVVVPHAIIRSWRAMKLLEHVSVINNDTLSACWMILGRDDDRAYHKKLSVPFGGIDKLTRTLSLIKRSSPTLSETEAMVKAFEKNNVSIDLTEIKEELGKGTIETSSLIETILHRKEA